ncbi:MAG TPA: hypothetical protein VK586_02555 [Streptosporangiaceae bacterium]|nr:hypothetical protein [Streptosporangiaceae bacterium]
MSFRKETISRVPAGKPEGGQFAEAPAGFARHATPEQTAVAANRLDPAARALCRATMLPPPGFEWRDGDRLAPAGATA